MLNYQLFIMYVYFSNYFRYAKNQPYLESKPRTNLIFHTVNYLQFVD